MYLDGDLNSKEALEFEELLKYDAALNEEFNFAIEIEAYFRNKKAKKFRESFLKAHLLYNEYEYVNQEINKTNLNLFMPEVKKLYIRLYKVASILISILVFALIITQIFTVNKTRSERIADLYCKPYKAEYLNRLNEGEKDLSNSQKAFRAYKNNQYNDAIKYFNKIPNFDTAACFYKGVSYVECGDYMSALNCFMQLIADPGNSYYVHSRWYIALTWLKINKPENAKLHLSWLLQNDRYYKEKAFAILTELNKR
jgi:hypothetical protein